MPPRLLPPETLGIAVAAGVRYVAMSPAIRTVLLRAAVFGIGASAVMALMPVVANTLLGGGPLTYGLLSGAFGLGAVAGALASARLREALSTEAIVRWASSAFAGAVVLIGISSSLAATMAGLFVTGAGWLLALSTFNVAVQMSAPRWVVARALSLYQMAAFSGLAAGSWWWGELAAAASVSTALVAAGGVMLGTVALGFLLPLAQTEELNLELLRHWKEPTTVVPVDARTGPVVITIEYRIGEADVVSFLAAMSERRRIRRRDGARNWRLLRDLADPQIWVERYETPTWLDYVRHNNRITHHDAMIPERIRALHRGPEPPRVRRMLERPTAPPVPQPPSESPLDPARLS
jgi:MFS family permease